MLFDILSTDCLLHYVNEYFPIKKWGIRLKLHMGSQAPYKYSFITKHKLDSNIFHTYLVQLLKLLQHCIYPHASVQVPF